MNKNDQYSSFFSLFDIIRPLIPIQFITEIKQGAWLDPIEFPNSKTNVNFLNNIFQPNNLPKLGLKHEEQYSE